MDISIAVVAQIKLQNNFFYVVGCKWGLWQIGMSKDSQHSHNDI